MKNVFDKKSLLLILVIVLVFLVILFIARRPILNKMYINAYSRGWWNTTLLLIENGTDVTTIDPYGQTVLHHACYNAPLDIIKKIVQKGADYKKADSKGNIPILIAAKNGRWDIVTYFMSIDSEISSSNMEQLLLYSISQRQINIASKLISRNISVNIYSSDSYGLTPLHLVIRSEYYESNRAATKNIIMLLLQNGADMNALSKPKKWIGDSYVGVRERKVFPKLTEPLTPLDMAITLGDKEIISLLKEHGAKETEIYQEEKIRRGTADRSTSGPNSI